MVPKDVIKDVPKGGTLKRRIKISRHVRYNLFQVRLKSCVFSIDNGKKIVKKFFQVYRGHKILGTTSVGHVRGTTVRSIDTDPRRILRVHCVHYNCDSYCVQYRKDTWIIDRYTFSDTIRSFFHLRSHHRPWVLYRNPCTSPTSP